MKLESHEYVKFYHFRYKNGIMNFEPVSYPDSNGGITVAVRQHVDNYYFGAAKCSRIDTYSKEYGRIRSMGISNSKHALKTSLLEKETVTDVAVQIAKNIENKKGIYESLNVSDSYEGFDML